MEQVIRPPRAAYDESADLKGGHSGEFELQGRRYRRDDFEVGVCIYIYRERGLNGGYAWVCMENWDSAVGL